MRFESSVTSVSWIPSEAVSGIGRLPFGIGVAHYDEPPPDVLADLEALRLADRFRFANELRAWIDVEDGRIVGFGHGGGGRIGSTTLRAGRRSVTFQAVAFPDLRPEPEVTSTSVRFVQTTGGRTGVAAPRHVRHRPFVRITAPPAWSTLALTLHTDGRAEHELVGASPFPRHWVYDADGRLVAKSGTTDFDTWFHEAFLGRSPWGEEDSPTLVTAVETALERQLSRQIMSSERRPGIRSLAQGALLVQQGGDGTEVFVLLDGVVAVEVDGERLAEIGPGAVLGERALLEDGRRTSTLRAVTPCRVAVVPGDAVESAALRDVSNSHRRETAAG